MRPTNVFLIIFLMTALTIGAGLQGEDRQVIDSAINNATTVFYNISLESNSSNISKIPNLNGFFRVVEEGIQFMGVLSMEVLRAGVYFGQDNPEYFEPTFMIKIMKLLVWLAIISLLIQPLFYLIVFIIMAGIWIKDKIKKKNKNKG